MKQIMAPLFCMTISVVFMCSIFGVAIFHERRMERNEIWNKIVSPDRIVYRTSKGDYYEFEKDTEQYNDIMKTMKKSIEKYNENGREVKEEEIKNVHEKSFVEFDYNTASKNYIFHLDINEGKVIKLNSTGGNIVSEKVYNQTKIKNTIKKYIKDIAPQKIEYKTMISRKQLKYFTYEDRQKFKEINYKIHQVKITNIEDYNKYAEMCDLVFEEKITEDTFKNNVVILTISSVPKINVEVNLGNIKYTYTYKDMEGLYGTYTSHALIVSKIVNSNCIYNTDESEIENKVYLDKTNVDYDKAVENIDAEVFVKNYDEFIEEYNNSTSKITEEQAKEIAEKGFKEAERICQECEKESQTIKTEKVRANNFFTRKTNEGDKTYSDIIECYVFTRTDDMQLNGVTIYIDKKLGKIIGGGAFGD